MNESYLYGLVGGMMIGVAAVTLYAFNGRILGVSGILSGLLAKLNSDFAWRSAFILGLVAGGVFYHLKFPVIAVIDASTWQLIAAGLLVGFGTVTGSGCTSGHGICGIARFSKRSMVATLVFIAAGMLTVWIKNRIGG